LVSWLERRGVEVRLKADNAAQIGRPDLGAEPDEVTRRAGLAIALGGDGTLLGAARAASLHDVPVMGVHAAGFGFLSEVSQKDLLRRLPAILDGEFQVQKRLMIQADILRKGRKVESHVGLNDVAVTVGAFSRLVWFRTFVGGYHLGDLPADGIIVSTPTGSTCYAMSVGAPILDPRLDALVIAPMAPFKFAGRPTVVPASSDIRLEVIRPKPCVLVVDGQEEVQMSGGDCVHFTVSESKARFVSFGRSFYTKTREKLMGGPC